MKQILLLPRGALSDLRVAELSEEGVVVVEIDEPERVRLLTPETPLPANDMLRCAVAALCADDQAITSGVQRETFVRNLNAALQRQEP